jgi:hypothetical protein
MLGTQRATTLAAVDAGLSAALIAESNSWRTDPRTGSRIAEATLKQQQGLNKSLSQYLNVTKRKSQAVPPGPDTIAQCSIDAGHTTL